MSPASPTHGRPTTLGASIPHCHVSTALASAPFALCQLAPLLRKDLLPVRLRLGHLLSLHRYSTRMTPAQTSNRLESSLALCWSASRFVLKASSSVLSFCSSALPRPVRPAATCLSRFAR